MHRKACLYTSVLLLIPLASPVTAKAVEFEESRNVEIGSGGNIRPENPYRGKQEYEPEWHAHMLWESRYVSEGRDNLSGSGILSASTELHYKNINIVPWFAEDTNFMESTSAGYSEFNLNVVYSSKPLGNLELFIGYTYIHARDSDSSSNDNEISLDLVYLLHDLLQISSGIYYSFDAGGAFTEIAVSKDILFGNALSINIRATIGVNAGYVADGHNGVNHNQLLASASYTANKAMALHTYIGYNQAINQDSSRYTGDEFLDDFFWVGFGISSQL